MKLLILIFGNICYSQEKVSNPKKKFDIAFSPGVITQGNIFGDLNILIGSVTKIDQPKVPPIIGISGLRIGVESNFRNGENYIIAPKVGFEFSMLILTTRISAINYIQNGRSEIRILPEIGVSLGGSINLTYGYGINLNDENINGLSYHRLGFSMNINKKLNKGFN